LPNNHYLPKQIKNQGILSLDFPIPWRIAWRDGGGYFDSLGKVRIMKKLAIIIAVAGLGLGSFLVSCKKEEPGPGLGKKAPSFTLTDQEGKNFSLSDHSGKIVVLEWTNPDCPFVLRHYKAGTMVKLAKEYQPRGVVWVAVNSTNYFSVEKNKQWHDGQELSYAVLDDKTGKVGRLFGAKTTPHIFIIDESGTIAYQGAIDDDVSGAKEEPINYARKALDELLTGQPVGEPAFTPYGCTVKYAK